MMAVYNYDELPELPDGQVYGTALERIPAGMFVIKAKPYDDECTTYMKFHQADSWVSGIAITEGFSGRWFVVGEKGFAGRNDPTTGELGTRGLLISDEPRQILEALPGWLRRAVVAYARFRIRRRE